MKHSPESVSFRVPLKGILRAAGKSLPVSLKPLFESYSSHFGRSEFDACDEIAGSAIAVAMDSDVETHRAIRQAFLLHEKLTEESLTKEQNRRATEKFLKMENRCRLTNKRIAFYRKRPCLTDRQLGIPNFWNRLKAATREITGDLSIATYRKICRTTRFGPGMTLSSPDPIRTTAPYKLIDRVTTTQSAKGVWADCISQITVDLPLHDIVVKDGLLKVESRVQVVPGNRVTFVPKTSVISRAIAIEPSANVQIQLAIHDHLAARFKRLGNSISDQNRNREMARIGSLTGEYATIDLSSASDTVAYELVRTVVPSDLFLLLDAVRSPVGRVGELDINYEKFSSMGNGSTFALETAIFLAVCWVVCEGTPRSKISVYGDDIIVPSHHYDKLSRVLRFLGFLPNQKKSFRDGPFRESCGFDGFLGCDVRPVYIKQRSYPLGKMYALHNRFFRKGLKALSNEVLGAIPKGLRRFGPEHPSFDGYLLTDDVSLFKDRIYNEATQSYRYRCYRFKVVTERIRVDLVLAANLYDGGTYYRGAPLRDSTEIVEGWTP